MLLRSCAAFVAVLASLTPVMAQEPAGGAGTSAAPQIVLPGVRKLTITGQYRLRYEGLFDFDFDSSTSSAAGNDYFTQRVRLGLDFDVSDDLRAFFQLQDAREWGEEASTTDDSADGLDLHQGYLDVRQTPAVGGSTRLGRQEISLGDQRLVGPLDWKSHARSFDGLLQTWKSDDGNDSLLAWVTQTREAINTTNDDQLFVGVQGSRTFGETSGDLYLMLLHDDGTAPGLSQNRFTLGTRWVTTCCEAWELGVELATQFGELAGNDIPFGETYAGHVHARYRLAGEWQPWIKLAFDAASGDDPATVDQERFNNLFPTGHAHWGMMDLAQWENLFNPWAQVGITPLEHADVSLAWHYFRAMEEGDLFRGPNGVVSPGGAGFSRTMGNEFDLLFTRRIDISPAVKSSVQLGYGVFLPGAGAEDANGTDDAAHFLYLQFDLRF